MKPISHSYSYTIDQCDVGNKALLGEFRTTYAEWVQWFNEDPHHNVCDQINEMMWNDAAYRAFREAERFSSEQSPTASSNEMLGKFLDRGYVSTQILDICKITDASSSDPKKGVISLRRMVDDIAKNRELMTRENYVCFDGLPYDYEKVWQAEMDALTPDQIGQARYRHTKGPQAWGTSERIHAAFDRLSGVDAQQRSRTDLISEKVFETINKWFKAPVLDTLRTHRNKFIGHAADATSRNAAPLSSTGLTLNELAEAQRIVIRIANAVGGNILYMHSIGGPVPTPQFDQFKNLHLPLIPEVQMQEMHKWWADHASEREAWTREPVDFLAKSTDQSAP